MPSPTSCPLCHGRGHYLAPYYSDFKPTLKEQICPRCQPVKEVSVLWTLLYIAALFVALKATAMAIWGD